MAGLLAVLAAFSAILVHTQPRRSCAAIMRTSERPALPGCRETAIFGPAKQTSSDEVFAAIKRTFQALDDEIIKEATSCDIADCQFGGSTAVIALRVGHVSHNHTALHV